MTTRDRLIVRLEAAARKLAARWHDRSPSSLQRYGNFSAAFDVAYIATRLAKFDGAKIKRQACAAIPPRTFVVRADTPEQAVCEEPGCQSVGMTTARPWRCAIHHPDHPANR